MGENLDHALSDILFVTNEIDITRALFETEIGLGIMMRSGVSFESCQNFIHSERSAIMASSLNFENNPVNLSFYVSVLYDTDKSFQSFLSQNSINKEEFMGSAKWVMDMAERKREKERFWSKKKFGAIPSMGTSWSYGIATDLGEYGVPFESAIDISLFDTESGYRNREITTLEGILERREEANVIIIDDDEKVARDIVGRFLKRIKLGISPPSLEHKIL